MGRDILNNKELIKYHNIMTRNRIYCKCGHSVVLPPKLNKIICHWCGNYVFKDKKAEFEYRMNQEMRKEIEKLKEGSVENE